MTFTEAAVEVLRLVGRPLHYKKLTEIAIERNLLSHVGKSPEITMSSRLATMVKKDRGEAQIVKVKPGVFGLRDWPKEVLAMGELEEGDVEEILEAIDDAETEAEDAVAEKDEATTTPGEEPQAAPAKPSHKLPGQEVFPEEADDDEPILAKVDEPAGESEESRRNNKKRRRNKKRRGEPDEASSSGDEGRREGRRDDRGRHERRDDRGRDRDRGDRGDRGERGGDRHREDRSRDARSQREPELRGDWQREPENGDLAGKELSDAIEATLASRGGRARPFVDIADGLVQRGRLQGSAEALVPTIAAAVRGDVARRTAGGQKPRFRVRYGEVALVDALHPQDVARAEQDTVRALSRHRDLVHRALVRKLCELPNSSLLEVLATWLNAVGVTSLRGVRKPGAGAGEFHLAGVLRRGPEEVAIAIVIVRDGTVGRERVVDVRGSLHRYGDARTGWIVSLRDVQSGAREEAAEAGAASVAVFDAAQLARSMEEAGVGVRRFTLPLVQLDFDLFDELRGPGAPPRPAREPAPQAAPVREEEEDDEDEEAEGEAAEGEAAEGAAAAEGGESGRRRRRRRRRRRGARPEEGGAEAEAGAETDAPAEADADEGDEREEGDLDEDRESDREPESDLDEDRELDDERDLDEDDERDVDLDDDEDRDLDDEDDDLDEDADDDLDDEREDPEDPDDDVEGSTELDVDDDLDDER